MKRLFLDTNIVIDFLLEREEWLDEAASILSLADIGEIEVYCSTLSLATASFFMEKAKMPHDVLRRKLSGFCEICQLSPVDENVARLSLASDFTDFEDALQYYSALAVKAGVIITRNGKDFKNSTLPVMTAADWLDNH
ncbi:MAG: PIN domain-containing protein [Paludibacteraceae bacterium]|nr:PIN domain-containing protein [Paludibacteraceae bacterium]